MDLYVNIVVCVPRLVLDGDFNAHSAWNSIREFLGVTVFLDVDFVLNSMIVLLDVFGLGISYVDFVLNSRIVFLDVFGLRISGVIRSGRCIKPAFFWIYGILKVPIPKRIPIYQCHQPGAG